ncbi:MAG: tRNA (adenosine(37)-N6)-threonylcarbamoyltransferase complex ATPase subunit type 1 TsaE [Alphaproteobacteria bacterium]|nr:tRNA (adenosine(37)-N6)-threonylcarbamoyltransferase complex ATPase subunit type 1 TsaE [Alphaproteobacteria bacterium]
MHEIEFELPTEADTVILGKRLAKIAKKGDVFALYGTLGMGKSVLARAFIQELCGDIDVPSPTFTLLQTYGSQDYDIYHFDLYRIKSPEDVFELGIEDAFYTGISLIEWPQQMGSYLPSDIFKIEITPFKNSRKLKITTSSSDKHTRLLSLKE